MNAAHRFRISPFSASIVALAISSCAAQPPQHLDALQLKPCRQMPRGWCSYTDAVPEAVATAEGAAPPRLAGDQ